MIDFEKTPPDVKELLGKRISQLGLKVEGSPVERYVVRLKKELVRKGIKRFSAVVYLTDEWGCPSGEPVIGVPFYLADPKLASIERHVNDLETEREIMMFMRHEAGHAFNYAYRLYATPEWRELFGPFNRRYRDHYRPVPFSRKYVRHMAGWYAQKHPDEDFAETFAVWLTPRSAWRQRYRGWPALAKLRYVDRIVRRLGDKDPVVGHGDTDKERAAILHETGSILDRVQEQAARLQASLGVKDRVVVSDYLDSVREIERRVQMAAQQDMSRLEIPDAPVGTPNDLTEHFKLMFDLMALAFQADITRVITLSMDREASMRTYTNLGIAEGFHPLSHHGNNPQKQEKLVQIQRYHTEVFAKFVERLSKAAEGDGTVLDHSTILYGSNMSNSDKHNNDPLPSAILGHAHGRIKGGQHLKYPQDSRFADLLVTLFDRNNIPVEKLGDSGGIFSEI